MTYSGGSRAVVKELAEEFLCPVCMEEYDRAKRRPKVLQCNHVLCAECIAQCLTWGWLLDYKLKCPLCRHVTVFEAEPREFMFIN